MLPIILTGVIAFVVALVIGIPAGILYRKKVAEKEIISAEEEAKRILNEAIKSAESKKREALVEAKEKILRPTKRNSREKQKSAVQSYRNRTAVFSRRKRRWSGRLSNLEKKEEHLQPPSDRAGQPAHEEVDRLQEEPDEPPWSRSLAYTAEEAKAELIAQAGDRSDPRGRHEDQGESRPTTRKRPTPRPGRSSPWPSSAVPLTTWRRPPSPWFPCPTTR